MTACACGLDLTLRAWALTCSHCDTNTICVAASCERCRRIGLGQKPS